MAPCPWVIDACCFETAWWSRLQESKSPMKNLLLGFSTLEVGLFPTIFLITLSQAFSISSLPR
jgi:hypothetical protein